MSDIQLNDAFFQKTAGWEVVKHARALLAIDKVLSSNYTPPVLKGVVAAGETTYRAGLVIKGVIDIDNLCTCRASRDDGIICAHSVAVGLHWMRGQAEEKSGKQENRKTGAEAVGPVRTATSGPAAVPKPARDGIKLRRAEGGEVLEIHVIFPPNLADSLARGRAMLVFEGATSRGRMPLNALVKAGPFRLSPTDAELLDAAELVSGGDTPGMVQLPAADFVELLPKLAGHPRLTVGRTQPFAVSNTPAALPLKATLEANGEITIALRPGGKPPVVFSGGTAAWVLAEVGQAASLPAAPTGAKGIQATATNPGRLAACPTLAPLALAPQFRGALQQPLRMPRTQVPLFLSQDWPKLSAGGSVEANFRLEDFELKPQPPKFILNLAGGLAQLTGSLQCAYGPRIMTVGVSAAGEGAFIPDPANPRRYATRDPLAEHNALLRLRNAGFTGPNPQGQWQLAGQERVLAFFAREFPQLEKAWEVSLEERLSHSTQKNLERVTPQFRITPSGEQWFDLEVSYGTAGGERFSAAEIQSLLQGGGRKLKNGKFAIIDSGAVEELQEVILDCAPQQRTGGAGTSYRMGAAQAGFLDSALEEQGFTFAAPPQWKERVRQQTGEATLVCPPLGKLDDVLRPYQKHGVAWMRFLRENGFGGVLADEMGLGKTLQVLAHLASGVGRVASDEKRASPSPVTRHPSRFLVVCPTTLVFNWAAEAAKFTPELRVLVLNGPDRHREFARIPESDLIITSYALIRRDAERYRKLEFDTVVLDEAQHIKNRQTQNAQAVKAIRAQHRLVLTGTPLENSVLDLWSIFDFLMPGYLGTTQDFRERYEVPIAKERDAATIARLAKRVRPFLLRRLKRDVVKELPAKLEQVSFCDLTDEQATVYQQLLAHTRKEVLEAVGEQGLAKSRMLVLTALLRLRQVCCDLRLLQKPDESGGKSAKADKASGKVQLFGELLDEIVDGGHRVLVFSQFTSMLALLREELEARELTHCYLDGSTNNRGEVVQKFQADESIPVFLISLKAGGVGLNLTGADTVIHFDPWWNPAVEDQATDRAHRIGQTRVVTSYKLITRGTVEEKILTLQRKKREITEATLTGEEAFTEKLSWDEIQELLS
jgi:superfamily II DNA or RNA helicase